MKNGLDHRIAYTDSIVPSDLSCKSTFYKISVFFIFFSFGIVLYTRTVYDRTQTYNFDVNIAFHFRKFQSYLQRRQKKTL